MTVTIEPADEGAPGVVVTDASEQRRCVLRTPAPVAPAPVDDDHFYFPVDVAAALGTGSVTLPSVVATFVRTADGAVLAELDHFDEQTFPAGEYSVELGGPVKLYLRVTGDLRVSTAGVETTVETDGEMVLGARSHHRHPTATVTTTADPYDLMAAVSTFGSALKTTSCERSYPTLRGHPPELELGEELSIPDQLTPPETGVTIELPPTLRYLYPAATLAYYLGATVEPGSSPRLVTDDGFEHPLDAPLGYERTVERTLKQVFLLDCLTRTEGYYPVDLHERRELDGLLGLDFAALYDRPLADQLRAYLAVPHALVEDHVPEWKMTTHLAATAENAPLLPHLVNDLAVLRLPRGQSVSESEAQLAAINEFTRDDFTRSAAADGGSGATLDSPTLVRPEQTDSLEQVWADERAPVGATKASLTAFQNRLRRETREGDIGVTVVCNDPQMADEGDLASTVYGSRTDLPFDVRVYDDLTTDALRAVLETDRDFLHYIGHIDADGFRCADGTLDVDDLETVGVDAFLLNACRSYEQGMALIERGAIGGVVTLSEVINSGATCIGKTMVRLLNRGFPLLAALNLARQESFVGGQYIVVGDGNLDVVQSDTGTPTVLLASRTEDGYRVVPKQFATSSHGMGTLTTVYNAEPGVHYLLPGELDAFDLSPAEFAETLGVEPLPVVYEEEFCWSDDLRARL